MYIMQQGVVDLFIGALSFLYHICILGALDVYALQEED